MLGVEGITGNLASVGQVRVMVRVKARVIVQDSKNLKSYA